MLKVANSVIDASRITGVLPVVNGGTGVTTSTGTGNTVLSATPTLSGDVTLSTGNLIPGTAAKGVNFTANTPAAGMTSQLLNWYEEGTWNPTISSQTGTPTSVTATGRYIRIGKLIQVSFRASIVTAGTAAGQMFASGIPFGSNTSATSAYGGGSEVSVTGIPYVCYVNGNSAFVGCSNFTNTGITWTNGYLYDFSVIYESN